MKENNTSIHEHFMSQCIELAKLALQNGNPPVGSMLVCNGSVIGEGIEAGKSSGDLTNHAEILAVRDAIGKGHISLLNQATLYSTHEPCIMCSYVLRHHKIPQIVFGIAVDYVGGFSSELKVLQTETVPKWGNKPVIVEGICKEQCLTLNSRFEVLLRNNGK
jgi:tRNA(adenine34) deaminase